MIDCFELLTIHVVQALRNCTNPTRICKILSNILQIFGYMYKIIFIVATEYNINGLTAFGEALQVQGFTEKFFAIEIKHRTMKNSEERLDWVASLASETTDFIQEKSFCWLQNIVRS